MVYYHHRPTDALKLTLLAYLFIFLFYFAFVYAIAFPVRTPSNNVLKIAQIRLGSEYSITANLSPPNPMTKCYHPKKYRANAMRGSVYIA